ncbi:MAG: FHA domain-containing protein [Candidatus Sedimenticola sp. (ex Thyasira tokunagai)]
MEKLVVLKDGVLSREVPMEKTSISIGRDPEACISLDDPSVSRLHAQITKIYTDYYVEDLESTNGTQLNGRAVKKHILREGDRLSIGSYKLRYDNDEADSEEDDIDKTVLIRPEAPARSPAVPERTQRKRPMVMPKTALLRFFRGPLKGQQDQITRSLYTIGKPGAAVAVIARRPQGFYLLHIGGSSLPKVNDKEIEGSAGVQLHHGDVVEVGEYLAEIIFEELSPVSAA